MPLVLVLALLFAASAPAGALASARPRLEPAISRLAQENPSAGVTAWVRFTDRAGAERSAAAFAAAREALSPRALARRERRGAYRDVQVSDLPVHEPYVRALVARGARLRGTSRWLNAASVEMPARLAEEVSRLPFVASVERVAAGRPVRPVGDPVWMGEPEAGATAVSPARLALAPGDSAYYGAAYHQMAMLQVPQLHAQGLTGAGVRVAILDGGFRTTHQAVAGLTYVARRDFVHGDLVVDDEAGQDPAGAATHGTATLACVGGVVPGTYAAAAFGAQFALAKTEDVATETPVEMDYWLFGAEWADSLGADVISSSLGYSDFDDPWPSYTYADMDGRTTVVTLAAVEAMRRGITVVTAAGNAGAQPWHYIIAPGDADSIVTSGAVDSLNIVTSFSSRGPSADGRIKPDVTALGRQVTTIPITSDVSYWRLSGTSFSTPLTAGVVALLLEAHPAWTPIDVRDALRATALNAASPNNDVGWGLVQGLAARQWSRAVADVPAPPRVVGGLALRAGPNPLRGAEPATIRFAAPAGAPLRVEIVDVAGRTRASLFAGASPGEQTVRWDGRDASGAPVPAGVYWVRASAGGHAPAVRSLRIVRLP